MTVRFEEGTTVALFVGGADGVPVEEERMTTTADSLAGVPMMPRPPSRSGRGR